MSNKGKPIGSGKVSRIPTTVHTIKFGSHWWRSQEDVDEYRWTQNIRRGAARAGWPTKTIKDLKAFEARRNRYRRAMALKTAREKEIQAKRDKLRQELGLEFGQNLMQLALAPGAEGVVLMMEAELDARDQLNLIKQMIEERTPITDFMIRVSNIVGAKL